MLRLAFVSALLACALPAHAHRDVSLAWIYAEANTGGSSGGHVALRMTDTVYHVQQAGGLWQIQRDDWDSFRTVYAGLQNRTLELAHLALAPGDLERVERRFARAYVGQQSELERRERLALDVAWLEAWQERRDPPPLRGAGLLARGAAPDPFARALRAGVEERFGERFLEGEISRLEREVEAFAVGRDELEALREKLVLREALRAIEADHGLAPEALLPDEGVLAERLSPEQREVASRFALAQQQAVLELLASSRPDRGRPLLLAAARQQALARSAATAQLVLLDPFASEADVLAAGERARPASQAAQAERVAAVVREGRAIVFARAAFSEPAYNLLELGAGLWRELARGAQGAPVRRLPRRALPDLERQLGFVPRALERGALPSAIDARREALAGQEERLLARYRYGVLERNCVTEMVRLLNDSFEDGSAARVLGAELAPNEAFGFIPFAFFEQARRRLRVERVERIPSHRERELARVLAEDPRLARRLSEAVTLTSSIYTPRLRDGSFLFFTDDVFWRRPLLGLLNLGFGAGSGVVGLAAAPLDSGRRARAAGSGVWYSLPELFFFNIRKGSFEQVPAEGSGGD